MPNWKKVITSGSDASLNNLDVTSTGSFDRVEANTIDLDRLSLTSTQTTTPPLQLTANSLQDGVGALRIDGSQADIFLNPSTATHTTVTFAVNNDQRLAFGMDNTSDFYITRRTGGTWYDDTFVLSRDTGELSLGYGLVVTGSTTSSDITIDDWGSVSASLSTLESTVDSIDSSVTLQDATNNGNTTTNTIITSATLSGSAVHVESSGQKTILDTERIAVSSTSTIIANITISDHLGAVIDYTVYHDNPNEGMRTGQIMAAFESSGQIIITDNSTADIGDTSAVTFSETNNGTTARITLNTPDADWNIRTFTRLL